MVVPDARAWLREGRWASAVVRGAEPPYWIRIWPAAVAVARQLAQAGELHGVRALDFGCGVGVPGVQAAALGASITFADLEADAVRFAAWNAERQPASPGPAGVRRADWSRGLVVGDFDLLILSDVTYHRQNHAPVRRQIEAVLDAGGCVLHADPGREESASFLAGLPPAWRRQTWWRDIAFDGRPANVRLSLLASEDGQLAAWGNRLAAPDSGGPAAIAEVSR